MPGAPDWSKYSGTTPANTIPPVLSMPQTTPIDWSKYTPIAPASGVTQKTVEPSVVSSTAIEPKIAEYKDKLAEYQAKFDQIKTPKTGTTATQTDWQKQQEEKIKNQGQTGYDIFGNPVSDTGTSSTVQTPTPQLTRDELITRSLQEAQNTYASVRNTLNPELQMQVDAINKQFDALLNMQKMANAGKEAAVDSALLRTGSSRYSPLSAAGISNTEISYGISQLSNIESQRQTAIANARAAAAKDSWDLVGKILGRVDELEKEQRDLLTSQNQKLLEQVRTAQISQAVSAAIDSGLQNPKDIFDAMSGNQVIGTLNVSSDEVAKAYSDLVGSPAQLGQDWNMFQNLLSSGELQRVTGNANPTFFDYLKAKDAATTNPTDPTLLALRQAQLQQTLLQLKGYIDLPTNPDGTVSEQNVQYGSAMKFALADASATEAKLRGQTFSELLLQGEQQKAKEFIFKTALETSNADTFRKIQGVGETMAAIDSFKQLVREMKDRGISTDIISGTAEDLARKAGATIDPIKVDYLSRASQILFNYRKSMTGVQFSYAEGQQYAKLFPNYQNTLAVNDQLINSLYSGLATQVEIFYKQKLGTDNYNYLLSDPKGLNQFGIGNQQVKTENTLDPDLLQTNSQPGTASFLGF